MSRETVPQIRAPDGANLHVLMLSKNRQETRPEMDSCVTDMAWCRFLSCD